MDIICFVIFFVNVCPWKIVYFVFISPGQSQLGLGENTHLMQVKTEIQTKPFKRLQAMLFSHRAVRDSFENMLFEML